MPNRLGSSLVLITLTLLLAAGCGTASGGQGADRGFVSGDGSLVVLPAEERAAAPDLVGTTLDGDTFRLADHTGEVVVLNVWASWCAPCRAEAPVLAATARDLAPEGVRFVGLDTRDSDTSARSFAQRFALPYPSVVDRDGELQLLFKDTLPPQAIPSTVIIDREGRVAARALGRVDGSALRGIVDSLVAESGSPQPAASASPSASG